MGSKKFRIDTVSIRDILDRYTIAPPEYQRGYVWKNKQKLLLLDSLFEGFPIGVLVLYFDENKDKYYIIDGLQRLNTLKLYYREPSSIVKFNEYYKKVEGEIKVLFGKFEVNFNENEIKKSIKVWYNSLDSAYKFERLAFFLEKIKANKKLSIDYENIEFIESLLNLLRDKIVIKYDQVPLIIYEGPKDDLPQLFKNINTGSVPLSTFEIFQSMWVGFDLNRRILKNESESYKKELEIVNKEYEIQQGKEDNTFNIFKALVGLNYEICCIDNLDLMFSLVKRNEGGEHKKYSGDSIAFYIYSTLICKTTNKVDKAINQIFYHNKKDVNHTSEFIKELNEIIIEKIKYGLKCIQKKKIDVIDSVYHSLYILYGLIISEYDIDFEKKTIKKRDNEKLINAIVEKSLYFEPDWFINENRQITFFVDKINSYDEQIYGGNF